MRERSLFVRTTLTLSALIAIITLIFSLLIRSYDYGQRFFGLGKTVLTLRNEHRDSSGAKHYLAYEDMVDIVGRLESLSTAIITFNLSGRSTPLFSQGTKSQTSVFSLGVGVGYEKLSGLTLKAGRFLEEGDEDREVCVISERIASRLQVQVLDRVSYAGRELEVVGVVAAKKPFDVSLRTPIEYIYVPVTLKKQLSDAHLMRVNSDLRPYITTHLVYRPGLRDELHEELKVALRNSYGQDHTFLIGEEGTAAGYLIYVSVVWSLVLVLIGGIALLVTTNSVNRLLSLIPDRGLASVWSLMAPIAAVSAIAGGVAGSGLQGFLIGSGSLNLAAVLLAGTVGVGLPVFIATNKQKRQSHA